MSSAALTLAYADLPARHGITVERLPDRLTILFPRARFGWISWFVIAALAMGGAVLIAALLRKSLLDTIIIIWIGAEVLITASTRWWQTARGPIRIEMTPQRLEFRNIPPPEHLRPELGPTAWQLSEITAIRYVTHSGQLVVHAPPRGLLEC